MKKLLLIGLCTGLIFSLGSCKDDEEEPDFLAGEWKLNTITLTGFPDDFNSNDGFTTNSFYGESSYIITFSNGNTFDRDLIGIQGQDISQINDGGSYSLFEDRLTLNPLIGDTHITLNNSFDVMGLSDAPNMTWETQVSIRVYSNANQGSNDQSLLEETTATATILMDRQ